MLGFPGYLAANQNQKKCHFSDYKKLLLQHFSDQMPHQCLCILGESTEYHDKGDQEVYSCKRRTPH